MMDAGSVEETTLEAGKILIVDDDQDFAESLEEYLENFGYNLHLAHTLDSAQEAVAAFRPQVALVDVRLGPSRGTDLISMVKDDWPDLLFVVMTAHADTDTAIEALQRGAYDYLRKPLNMEVLSSTLSRCFRNLSLQREKEAALEQLRVNEARFRRLIEGSVHGVAIHDQCVPLFVNQAFATIFGYPDPEELLALPDLKPLFAGAGEELAATADGQEGGDFPADQMQAGGGVRKDGVNIHIEVISQPIEWEGRMVTQTTVADVTQRTELEDQLRQAQKMEAVGQLAGGVAHDINNMLQIIRGYTEVAMAKSKENPGAQPSLEKVLNAADSASNLTRQLLAFSRQEVLKPVRMDVNEMLRQEAPLLKEAAGEQVVFRLQAMEGPLEVEMDRAMIGQVLSNICINAGEAMPGGGPLTVSTGAVVTGEHFPKMPQWAKAQAYAMISVTDQGQGMAPDLVGNIFEPFFTTKDKSHGAGLGLSMAYGIIRQHKGNILVESVPGQGSTFRVYLPLVDPSQAEAGVSSAEGVEASAASVPDGAAAGKAGTILFADDQEELRVLMRGLLEEEGYSVLTAGNGEEALAVFEEHAGELDLLILDVVMPKVSGREVYERIRAGHHAVPVIFSTGYSSQQLDEGFVRDHDFKLLQKPYSPQVLLDAVQGLLAK